MMIKSTLWRGRSSWWIYSLLSAFVLMALQALTSSLSRRHRWIFDGSGVNLLPEDELMGAYLNETALGDPPLDQSIMRGLEFRERWRRWTMRLYLIFVLLCALYGILSLLLPRPPYYPLVIILLPFISAYFLARIWMEDSRRSAPQHRPLGLYPLSYMA